MTNFEHMTEEEKKIAIINGMHITNSDERKVCPINTCSRCKSICNKEYNNCKCLMGSREKERWLNAEEENENEKISMGL